MFLVMKVMNVSEAKAQFCSLVQQAQKGESTLICQRNIPVATLQPHAPQIQHQTQIGWAKGDDVQILGDLTEPALPESDWSMMQ
jgi:antitoxin (DNA-binding transcriptional repressor) of toxin-antitoxin stability system